LRGADPVFELRRQRAVTRPRSPAVGQWRRFVISAPIKITRSRSLLQLWRVCDRDKLYFPTPFISTTRGGLLVNDYRTPPDGPEESNGLPIGGGLRAALALLQHALDCAENAQAPPWDFALEIGQLYAAGLSITDLRWMVVKEFVEHGDETSVHGNEHRSFTPSRGLNFLPTTCVLLTIKGAALAARQKAASPDEIPAANGKSHPMASLKPQWDAARRELSLGGRMVKRFHVPARNQELILSAFQEEHWPESIDDPLADDIDIDPKTRLNDAIYRLNHKQIACLLRFHVNRHGSGVCWSVGGHKMTRQHPGAGRESLAAV
jgi:hypothetical protein